MSSRDLWRAMSGVLCVYKHADMSMNSLKKIISNKMVTGAKIFHENQRLPKIKLPIVEPHPTSGALLVVGENEVDDYRYHNLVSGGFLRTEDVQLNDLCPLETPASGVCLIGTNDESEKAVDLLAKSWVNCYRIEAVLGKATKNNEMHAKVTHRASFEHVTKHKMEKVLSRIESRFRSAAFEYANVDMHSEEAFEIARRGLPRAQLPDAKLIVAVDLLVCKPPFFSIDVHVIGEDCLFLRDFISSIGSELGTVATCVKLRRRRFGPFDGDDALLEKQINLQNIVRNIVYCRRILDRDDTNDKVVVDKPAEKARSEREAREIFDGLGLNLATSDEEYDAMRPAWPRRYE